jgi:hypothetical protein
MAWRSMMPNQNFHERSFSVVSQIREPSAYVAGFDNIQTDAARVVNM